MIFQIFKENQVTMECFIDEKYHRTVIGLKGRNVQQITSEYNVQIKFPDRSSQNGKLDRIKKTRSLFGAI